MAPFSDHSRANLQGVHPRLVQLLAWVTTEGGFDCSILNGVRTLAQQEDYVRRHLSETLDSKHLPQADGYGHAIDAAPTPQRWDDSTPSHLTMYDVQLVAFLFFVKGVAKHAGLDVTIGADWNNNDLITDNHFNDLDHIQLTHDDEPLSLLPSLGTKP